jgi:hypothetical protein
MSFFTEFNSCYKEINWNKSFLVENEIVDGEVLKGICI